MPTYEYECNKCGHRFEKFQSMKDDPIRVCPECGGDVRRLLGTGAGFLFKGSGFYITDYRSSSYKEKAKKEGGAASGKSKEGGDAKPKGSTGSDAGGSSKGSGGDA